MYDHNSSFYEVALGVQRGQLYCTATVIIMLPFKPEHGYSVVFSSSSHQHLPWSAFLVCSVEAQMPRSVNVLYSCLAKCGRCIHLVALPGMFEMQLNQNRNNGSCFLVTMHGPSWTQQQMKFGNICVPIPVHRDTGRGRWRLSKCDHDNGGAAVDDHHEHDGP